MLVVRKCWLWTLTALCLLVSGCPDDEGPRKPDPTKGTVAGIVICTDTGKPARFAEVQLLPASMIGGAGKAENSNPDLDESATTGLDGRFTIEAVPPGDYYAYAMLNGYLDPERGIDFNRAKQNASDDEQIRDALNQWKDHFVELTVSVQHTSDLSIQLERGAEIDGTVSFDDSSPAIGMRFQLLRKTAQGNWTGVGDSGNNGWALEEKSDGHGRYRITNLPAGEYKVCALLPIRSEEAAPRVCLGGSFRKKNAEAVKVNAGETRDGADIVIPLTGMYTISGTVSAAMDGHTPAQAQLHLLYADDREEARTTAMRKDGSFSFAYVPAGEYILRVTDAQDSNAPGQASTPDNSSTEPAAPAQVRHYAAQEIPVNVQGEMNDLGVTLTETQKAAAIGQ